MAITTPVAMTQSTKWPLPGGGDRRASRQSSSAATGKRGKTIKLVTSLSLPVHQLENASLST